MLAELGERGLAVSQVGRAKGVEASWRPPLPPLPSPETHPPCLPRPSPTTSSPQTTTKARSPTGSPLPACPSPSGTATTSPHSSFPHSSANKCLLKVAGYAALLEQYQKAIDIYEQVGTGGVGGPHPAPSQGLCLLLSPGALFWNHPSPGSPLPLPAQPLPCHPPTPSSVWLNILHLRLHAVSAPSPWLCPSHTPRRASWRGPERGWLKNPEGGNGKNCQEAQGGCGHPTPWHDGPHPQWEGGGVTWGPPSVHGALGDGQEKGRQLVPGERRVGAAAPLPTAMPASRWS